MTQNRSYNRQGTTRPPAQGNRQVARTAINPAEPALKAREGKVSILDKMASRLSMDPMDLQRVLMATVFQGASNEEFASLLVVSEAYGLNPLTKEIYAFPKKGGGIVPVVSIDGWIRIINEHPQLEGIEWEDMPDAEGNLYAIATTIHRKDRSIPVRIIEYLSECKQGTDPWNKMPARMLRHKSTIQCARYAFGFAGIYDESDVGMLDGGSLENEAAPIPPLRQAGASSTTQEPAPTRTAPPTNIRKEEPHDKETGELPPKDKPPADESDDSEHPAQAVANEIIARAGKVENMPDLNSLRSDNRKHVEAMPDDIRATVDQAYENAEKRLKAKP